MVINGTILSAILTAIIAVTAVRLTGFQIVGSTVAFAYPWRLVEPTVMSQLTAWVGYVLHNIFVWGIIYIVRKNKPKFRSELRWYNWALLIGNLVFVGLHILQTQVYYDGLAQDVPEITALGSLALIVSTLKLGLFKVFKGPK